MKVIFLDIDGVLNRAAFHKTELFEQRKKQHDWKGISNNPGVHWILMDPECVERLNYLVKLSGAKVVVSSQWRLEHQDDMAEQLAKAGCEIEVIGMTPDLAPPSDGMYGFAYRSRFTPRWKEIQAWLDQHPEVASFVVFDDDDDMDGVRKNFVKTNWSTGLCDSHVRRALVILEGKK